MGDRFVSGFTIVRNAVRFDLPIEAALRSISPLCDEIVVNVGDSEDETLEIVRSIDDPKIRVLESVWGDPAAMSNVLHSIETNRALDACRHPWCFYVQADEVLHEDDVPRVRAALERHGEDARVEALVFDYLHFYGSFDWVGVGRRWYRREVRLVRKASGIRSVGGAQGFRVAGRKPRAAPSGARIFHYGWSKRPEKVIEKRRLWQRYRGLPGDPAAQADLYRNLPELRRFQGSHPRVMRDWIAARNWDFDPRDYSRDRGWGELKLIVSDAIERVTGWRPFEHRNFRWAR